MFEDSDFEFDDETIDAVLDKMPTVVPNKKIQKRPCEETTPFEEHGHTTTIENPLQPVKKLKEHDTLPNKFHNTTNAVYDQFCSIERTSVNVDCADNSDRLSPIIFHNKPSSSSYLHKNTIMKKVVHRKFPGPAGLLPEKMDKTNCTKTTDDDLYFKNMQNTQELMLVSQCCELSFDDKLWKRMLEDLEHEKIDNEHILPDKYNIQWIKTKAVNNQLVNQKAPFLAALIQSIECSKITAARIVTLKDKTGEIQATIDYDLYKQYTTELIVGSIIIIKQFSVLSTCTSYVLNITVKNLIRIYHENDEKKLAFHDEFDVNNFLESSISNSEQIKIINVQDLSVKDIIINMKEISCYKKATQFSDEELGAFLNNFDNNESNLINSSSSVNLFNNNQLKIPPQVPVLKKTCSNSSLQPKICFPSQSSNTISKTASSSSIRSNADNGPIKNSKFNFKAKNFNKENNIFNMDKKKRTSDTSAVNSSQSCSQISVKADNAEEEKIVENIFEGLDADSFFDDF